MIARLFAYKRVHRMEGNIDAFKLDKRHGCKTPSVHQVVKHK